MDLRYWLSRLPAAPIAIVLAAAGFVALQRSSNLGGSALAYAESIHHPVAPTAAGRIAEMRVQVGQPVKAGEAIAAMEDKEVVLIRRKAAAQLEKLRADVAAAILDEESKVTRAELWVLKARADERGDRAELEEITHRADRLDELLSRHMVAASDAEVAREKMRALEARVRAYDQAIGSGQAALSRDVDANHLRNVEARLEPFRKAVLVQQATVEQLDLTIEQLTLRAPIDGVVSTLDHRAGDVVSAGTPIVSIVSARAGMVTAIVPEAAVTKVAAGSRAEIRRGGALTAPVQGKVVELAPEVEEMPARARPSPTVPAWGRRATIALSGTESILPGEAFHVTFR